MGILDKIGLKKKEEEADKKAKKTAEPAPVKSEEVTEKEPKEKSLSTPVSGKEGEAYRFLIRPLLTEKAIQMAGTGKYAFMVSDEANKNEVRKSIEKVYGVHVTDVRILNVPSKVRRYGRTSGRTKSWKKALITLQAGEKISGIIESVG